MADMSGKKCNPSINICYYIHCLVLVIKPTNDLMSGVNDLYFLLVTFIMIIVNSPFKVCASPKLIHTYITQTGHIDLTLGSN